MINLNIIHGADLYFTFIFTCYLTTDNIFCLMIPPYTEDSWNMKYKMIVEKISGKICGLYFATFILQLKHPWKILSEIWPEQESNQDPLKDMKQRYSTEIVYSLSTPIENYYYYYYCCYYYYYYYY